MLRCGATKKRTVGDPKSYGVVRNMTASGTNQHGDSLENWSTAQGSGAPQGGVGMSRYYFHVCADGELIKDEEGVELDPECLDKKVLKELAEAAAAEEGGAKDGAKLHFQVVDERGQVLFVLPFRL